MSQFTSGDTFSIPLHAAGKVMDGELVVINLQNGLYYSAGGAGAQAWQLLQAGASLGQAADAIAAFHAIEATAAQSDLASFVDALLERGLVAAEARSATGAQVEAVVAGWIAGPYAPPSMLTFDDMEQAFAIDPPLLVK